MTKNEMLVLKENILGGMNSYIIENGDEDIWETWITLGVPDCATEEDLQYIAENETEWLSVIKVFADLCKAMGAM